MRRKRKAKTKRPTAIDCFAGCGGMSEGLRRAGYDVIGAIEIDKDAAAVYKLNHPDTKVWRRDITRLPATKILRDLGLRKGQLDLLGGCPPCQGFSTLRTYNGKRRIRDKQNDLIFQFQRLVLKLRPKRVMMENVPGLEDDFRLKKFRARLEGAGYASDAEVHNVVEYGVPQRRRRLVLLASRVPGTVEFAAPSRKVRTVGDAIGKLPKAGKSGDPLHDLPENRSRTVAARIRRVPRNGGSRSALPSRLCLRCHKDSNGFKDVYGRMAWDQPAPTITTGCFNPSKGRFLHPTAHRAITMREAALLQTFPRKYQFPARLGKVRLATMIGNALPPEFIRRHALSGLQGTQTSLVREVNAEHQRRSAKRTDERTARRRAGSSC
jgi:DNA (cytosine-5)-methyltransferase 1